MNGAHLIKKDYESILQFQASLQESKYDFPEKVLKKLYDMFGFHCLSFFLVDQDGKFFNYEGINFSKQALKIYTEYYYLYDPIYHKNASKTPYGNEDTVVLNDLTAYPDFEKTEYYNDFFKKCDFYHEIGIYLKANGKHIGAMGAMRPKSEQNFTKREHALLNTLTTIISQQLKYCLDRSELEKRNQLYKNSFLNNPIGMVILGPDCNIMDSNPTAEMYCKDILGAAKKSPVNPIEKVMRNILNSNQLQKKPEGSYEYSGYPNYSFEIIPTIVPAISKFNVNYVIYIKNGIVPSETETPCSAVLTKRELEIVDLIAQGLTNKQIGAALFISHQTVRTHIENVMTKLQVQNRTAILCKLGKVK